METIKTIADWIAANYQNVFYFLLALVGVLEMLFRIIKTEKPLSFLERVGAVLRQIMDFLKIPNRVVDGDKK